MKSFPGDMDLMPKANLCSPYRDDTRRGSPQHREATTLGRASSSLEAVGDRVGADSGFGVGTDPALSFCSCDRGLVISLCSMRTEIKHLPCNPTTVVSLIRY